MFADWSCTVLVLNRTCCGKYRIFQLILDLCNSPISVLNYTVFCTIPTACFYLYISYIYLFYQIILAPFSNSDFKNIFLVISFHPNYSNQIKIHLYLWANMYICIYLFISELQLAKTAGPNWQNFIGQRRPIQLLIS